MTQDELEDAIWLAMLRNSQAGRGPIFDLQELCKSEGIPATFQQLLAFVTTNRGIDGSSERSALKSIIFEISAEGLRRAKGIEERIRPQSLSDRIAADKFQKVVNLSISLLSFLVSIGALIVAIIALNKVG